MVRRLAWMVMCLLGLAGCANQVALLKAPADRVTVSPGPRGLNVNILTETTDTAKQPQIDAAKSYAEQAGRRYQLLVKPHAYRPFETKWRLDEVHLLISSPSGATPQTVQWANGDWLLHLEFSGGGSPLLPTDVLFKLKNEYYVWPMM